MRFSEAFELLIAHEGGYVFDSHDPGGETQWGISKRSYPHLDIKNLTRADAARIYHADYWKAIRADELPGWVRFDLMDAAVHSGPATAKRWLQFAVGVSQDGIIGPHTMDAVHSADPKSVLLAMNAARLMYMAKRKNWKHHGKGWAIRMAKNLFRAARA